MVHQKWKIGSLILLGLMQSSVFADPFTYTGYIDGSYNYLLEKNKFTSGTYDRVNDIAQNGFSLQQAFLTIHKTPVNGFSGLVTGIIGKDAYNLAILGMNPNIFDNKNIGFVVPDAYVQYQKSSYTWQLGLQSALQGIEGYDYTQVSQFSRSILYGYSQAGSRLGLRLIKAVSDQLNFTAGVGNGWNTVEDPTHLKGVEVGLNYTVPNKFSFNINDYNSQQFPADNATKGPTSRRNVFDCFGTINVTEKFSLGGNYDYGVQGKATLPGGVLGRAVWSGIAAYGNYQFNEVWSGALRGEYFLDPNGFRTGVKQNWEEMTLTLAWLPIKHLTMRGETRRDFSNKNSFLQKHGVGTSRTQQSFALEALYQFS